ncbi:TKL/DRK protein kinase [Phytophthora cinnamomi]|uniref:TKL/DRK protein kinase n=1 Tax=Phytophthora cinnamomi TaxID=4785 RepID=UPI00355A3010|nr:TKL/DRK protein kinase [Phytophthora cinnamomi]
MNALRRKLVDSRASGPADSPPPLQGYGRQHFAPYLVIPLAVGGLILVAVFWVGLCYRRRVMQRRRGELMVGSPSSHPSVPTYAAYEQHSPSSERWHTLSVGTSRANPLALDQTYRVPPRHDEANCCDDILHRLLQSPRLAGKRIPFQRLRFRATLSSGASGEVWLALYRGQQVAVKQLLQTHEHSAKDVRAFAEEIALTASLSHPHVVAFVGVAWGSVDSLAMVMEYCPMGDLRRFLKESGRLLSWTRDKLRMAVGVAHALRYIHGREPPIIHRDLKSMNILLTETLETRVVDFGVSRACEGGAMSAGVGTPYWIAPEVLEGRRYSQQADIYSFGVVLAELDTCRTPFADVVTAQGEKPKPLQILRWVLDGRLAPTFSEDCPRWIRSVGRQCLQRDPELRPTAAELTQMLRLDARHRIYTL